MLDDGREYLLEKPLTADFGFIRAHRADKLEIWCIGRRPGRNPVMATACRTVIAEVDEIVEVGG